MLGARAGLARAGERDPACLSLIAVLLTFVLVPAGVAAAAMIALHTGARVASAGSARAAGGSGFGVGALTDEGQLGCGHRRRCELSWRPEIPQLVQSACTRARGVLLSSVHMSDGVPTTMGLALLLGAPAVYAHIWSCVPRCGGFSGWRFTSIRWKRISPFRERD